MSDLQTIMNANWNAENVAKPSLIEAPEYSRYFYSRVISFRRVQKIEDYMGIVSRSKYTPESYDAFLCYACSSTEADCIDIADEARRICAQFSPSGSDKILQWEGGDWELTTPYRWEIRFIIMKKKSGAAIPNA